MIFSRHVPAAPLGEFVEWFWYFDQLYPAHRREHILPDGTFELVIDLRSAPRKLFNRQNPERYESYRRGWVSGAHSQFIVVDALPNSSMVGVHFKPGGAAPLLGLSADELRDRVVEIDAIWGVAGIRLRDRLLAAPSAASKFSLLEDFLLERLSRLDGASDRRRLVQWALGQIIRQPELSRMRAIAHQLGVSHKHLISQFKREVGLPPKLFCRIQRFQRALSQAHAGLPVDWADVAYDCGYFDQSHFVHDFQTFAGLNPCTFTQRRLDDPNYVPVG